jgi:hypothetical protein
MSGCKGLHCPGCGNGGSGLAVVVLGVAVAAVVLRKPAEHAADVLLHVVEIAAITAVSAIVLGGVLLLTLRYRRRRARAAAGLPAPRVVRAITDGNERDHLAAGHLTTTNPVTQQRED